MRGKAVKTWNCSISCEIDFAFGDGEMTSAIKHRQEMLRRLPVLESFCLRNSSEREAFGVRTGQPPFLCKAFATASAFTIHAPPISCRSGPRLQFAMSAAASV